MNIYCRYRTILPLLLYFPWSAAMATQTTMCSDSQLADILAPANSENNSIEVRCSATLPATARIGKRLIFSGTQASGITFDCNGATIDSGKSGKIDSVLIRSIQQKEQWQTPQNITLRNCRIEGSVRIQGMASNGEGTLLRTSSLKNGHTQRTQQASPSNIRLENLVILGQGRIPLYIAPGVTQITVSDSHISGRSNSVAVYLDAESANNTFIRNTIDSKTARELIAIDSSARNTFQNNRFSSLNKGGIYLYRNCGEGGTIRHQTPSENIINNNIFFYRKYNGSLPSIWLGARNGKRNYCQADAGYSFGSSADNADFADNNTVSNNRIYRLQPQTMIRDHGQNNRISGNQTVW